MATVFKKPNNLTDVEEKIYDLVNIQEKTVEEAAHALGVSRSRVVQVVKQIRSKQLRMFEDLT